MAVKNFEWAPGAPLAREPPDDRGDGRPKHARAVVGFYLAAVQAAAGGSRALGPELAEIRVARSLGVSRRCVVYARRALSLAGVLKIWQPPAENVPEWARTKPMLIRRRGGGLQLRELSYTCVTIREEPGRSIRRRLMRPPRAQPPPWGAAAAELIARVASASAAPDAAPARRN